MYEDVAIFGVQSFPSLSFFVHCAMRRLVEAQVVNQITDEQLERILLLEVRNGAKRKCHK